MQLYQIAASAAAVLFLALCFVQVIIRNQVHRANYGNEKIRSWDVRFGNNFLGPNGIWKRHKTAYDRSMLRSVFIVLSAGLIASLLFAIVSFLRLREKQMIAIASQDLTSSPANVEHKN